MTDVLMPALSPTMEEGTLAKWHVKVGDTVKSGDVIAEIETDKATMEVEAVDEGVVRELLVPEGTEAVKAPRMGASTLLRQVCLFRQAWQLRLELSLRAPAACLHRFPSRLPQRVRLLPPRPSAARSGC